MLELCELVYGPTRDVGGESPPMTVVRTLKQGNVAGTWALLRIRPVEG